MNALTSLLCRAAQLIFNPFSRRLTPAEEALQRLADLECAQPYIRSGPSAPAVFQPEFLSQLERDRDLFADKQALGIAHTRVPSFLRVSPVTTIFGETVEGSVDPSRRVLSTFCTDHGVGAVVVKQTIEIGLILQELGRIIGDLETVQRRTGSWTEVAYQPELAFL